MDSVRWVTLAAVLASAGWCASAGAQVYRIVGPDGRVTFSDRPPADAKAARPLPLASAGSSGTTTLPSELRAASSRFPVVLYTGVDCGPCENARGFLARRGVPFTEKTVTTEDDIAALRRLAGVARVPFATIGGQHIRGFSEPEWSGYLDAAGYPQVSQLPPTWRNPAATPLVAIQNEAPRTARAPESPGRAEVQGQPAENPDNPAGIRF